jgi:putative ATP-grasp target RiPP
MLSEFSVALPDTGRVAQPRHDTHQGFGGAVSSAEAGPIEPYGMRFAARQTSSPPSSEGVVFNPELQIAITADGNPWASMPGQDTSSGTNSDSRNDEGTDLW